MKMFWGDGDINRICMLMLDKNNNTSHYEQVESLGQSVSTEIMRLSKNKTIFIQVDFDSKLFMFGDSKIGL